MDIKCFQKSYFHKINNITDNCNFQSKRYSNIIELYNIYYNNYIKLLENKNVIFINYFKLLDSESYLYVNEKLKDYNLQIHNIENYQKNLNKPSKQHGNPVKNYNEAYEKYFTEQEKYKNLCIENNLYIDSNIVDYFEKIKENKNNEINNLDKKIIKIRKKHKLNRKEFAEKLNVKLKCIINIEDNSFIPKNKFIKKIEKKFGCKLT